MTIAAANTTPAPKRIPRRSNLYFVWRGVLGDPVARIAAAIIAGMVLAAIFAPWIAP